MAVSTIKFSQFVAASLSNTATKLVGVSSDSGGENIQIEFPLVWSTAARPVSPALGLTGYNTDLGQIEFWNGADWTQLAAGGSGSVNLGSQYALAYYATTGTAVSNLLTANNSILATSGIGIPAWTTALPSAVQVGVNSLGNGSSASATTFWRGDGMWAAAELQTPTVTSNYVVLGTLYIQWGITGTIAANSFGSVTFPISFPNNVLNVVATCSITTSGVASAAGVSNFSPTGFVAHNTTQAGPGNAIFWQAIGY